MNGQLIRFHQCMRVDDEVANPLIPEQGLTAGHEATLGQPQTPRSPAEVLPIELHSGRDLSPHGRPVAIEQRKEGVGRGRGDDLELTAVLKLGKGRDQIATVAPPGVSQALEALAVEPGETLVVRLRCGALDLSFRQLDQPCEPFRVALLQQRVGEHGDQWRRQRQSAAEGHAVARQSLEDLQQR